MENKHIILLYGEKNEQERTKLFLPDVAISNTICIDKFDDSLLEMIKKKYYTYEVIVLRAGLGVEIGFWEKIINKNIIPGQIACLCKRIALDAPTNGLFQAFQASNIEMDASIDPMSVLSLDCWLSHGVTFYEALSAGPNLVKNIRDLEIAVAIDRGIFVYEINDQIINKMESDYSSDKEIDIVVDEIRKIKSGKFIKSSNVDNIIKINNEKRAENTRQNRIPDQIMTDSSRENFMRETIKKNSRR